MAIETRPQPGKLFLTFEEYYELNCTLSIAKGYDLSKDTQRVLEMNPRACKTSIIRDKEGNITSYVPKLVANISSQLQIDFPELFDGKEFHKSFVPVDERVQEFIIQAMNLQTMNWTIQQFIAVKGIGESLTFKVSAEVANNIPSEVADMLNELQLKVEVL